VAEALAPAFATAALVLCVAGVAKLRSGPRWALLGAAEIGLGGSALFAPGRVAAGAVACAFAIFSVAAFALARRGASCGCFGERDEPASAVQAVLSATLAAVALASSVWGAHGLNWLLARPASSAVVLVVGVLASAYGAVLAYTQLPRVWGSW
jgi:hypothetical protein